MTSTYDMWLDSRIDDYDEMEEFDKEITELLDEPEIEAENYALYSDKLADEAEDKWRKKYEGPDSL